MNNFTLITALLLCSFSWISVSASESHTVEVQSGGDVTLMCTNMSSVSSVTFWFRLVNASNVSCVSIMYNADTAKYCNGFQNGRFNMSTNISTLFLQIKQVDVSDSGLYFCGFFTSGNLLFSVTHLNVEGSDESHDEVENKCKTESGGKAELTIVILGALMVFLLNVIIVLVVKIRKLQTADEVDPNPEQSENVDSDDLNYAAVTFRTAKGKREQATNVIYAATR